MIELRCQELLCETWYCTAHQNVVQYLISWLCPVFYESKLHLNGYVYESLIWNSGCAPMSISSPGRGPISRYKACKLMCGDSVGTLWQPAASGLRVMADLADEHNSWERVQSAVGDECHWKYSGKFVQYSFFKLLHCVLPTGKVNGIVSFCG